MFRTTGSFDKLLEKATSNLLLEPDWVTTIQICDLIRQNDIQPKYAIASIKKKLYSQNPHCAMYALQVLESMVKNCGSIIHNEVASKETCEMFRELAKTSPHENVRQKVLELIQGWAFAFRKKPKYRAVLVPLKMDLRQYPSSAVACIPNTRLQREKLTLPAVHRDNIMKFNLTSHCCQIMAFTHELDGVPAK